MLASPRDGMRRAPSSSMPPPGSEPHACAAQMSSYTANSCLAISPSSGGAPIRNPTSTRSFTQFSMLSSSCRSGCTTGYSRQNSSHRPQHGTKVVRAPRYERVERSLLSRCGPAPRRAPASPTQAVRSQATADLHPSTRGYGWCDGASALPSAARSTLLWSRRHGDSSANAYCDSRTVARLQYR